MLQGELSGPGEQAFEASNLLWKQDKAIPDRFHGQTVREPGGAARPEQELADVAR